MIKANELRIGNFLYADGQPSIIGAFVIGELDIASKKLGNMAINYEPIPLTEEWLVNFGFHSHTDDQWEHKRYDNVWLTKYEDMCPSYQRKNIEYVHQLQNLFFALTGEELKLNQEVK